MSLHDRAAQYIARIHGDVLAASLIYTRGGIDYPIRGIAGRSLITTMQPGNTAAMVRYTERDYLIGKSELDKHSLGEPLVGDRITQTIHGVPTVFVVARRIDNKLAWEWSDPERLTYRIHVKPAV